MKEVTLNETFGQHTSKVTQLADMLSRAISQKRFVEGDPLPSINELSRQYAVSRDTVFKAFNELRERRLIDSTPGKGYFVTGQLTNVLLLLDQYTPFKETLYNSFVKKLSAWHKVDLLFHQYNERLFNTIIRESIGKYSKYIIMNFSNEVMSPALRKITPSRLLLLDLGHFNKDDCSYICQDFEDSFVKALERLSSCLESYTKFVFLFPKSLKHPQSSKTCFTEFCERQGMSYIIEENPDNLVVEPRTVYLAVKQQDVVLVVKKGKTAGLKCGKDYGLLAYNDIPSYEVIDDGITTLSIDWQAMGNEAAEFVLNNRKVQKYLPTEIIMRHSL